VLALVVALAYLPPLRGAFHFDDVENIPANPTIDRLTDLGRVFSPPEQVTVSGRPVLNLTLKEWRSPSVLLTGIQPRSR
jgi:hypothetical protein